MYQDAWAIMRNGNVENALSQMRNNLAIEAQSLSTMPLCTSETMELGIAYLWTGDYRAAWETFDRYNRQFADHGSGTYEMAGVAQWCTEKSQLAVTQWQRALHCDFKDTGGLGVTPPLLLLFASIFEPDVIAREDVEGILEQKAADPRSGQLPYVQFVLGQIQEQQLRDNCDKSIFDRTDKRFDEEVEFNQWRADFWIAVLEHDCGNDGRANQLLRRVAHLTWEDYDRNSDLFLTKLWSPEFFLARYEMQI
jgi:lipoprotein NlpI